VKGPSDFDKLSDEDLEKGRWATAWLRGVDGCWSRNLLRESTRLGETPKVPRTRMGWFGSPRSRRGMGCDPSGRGRRDPTTV